MRNILVVLAATTCATLLALASASATAPAYAQTIFKDGKSQAKRSTVSKGPSKSSVTKAPSTTFKVVKTPSTASKAPVTPFKAAKTPSTATKAPSAFAKKPPTILKAPTVVAKKAPPAAKKPPVYAKKPPVIIKKPPVIVHYRPWRPGLRWRWLLVPTIIIAQSLEWCHYHLYPIAGVRYHRNIECHEHFWWVPWDHPSIRYVEAY